jgi:hypothetical protein
VRRRRRLARRRESLPLRQFVDTEEERSMQTSVRSTSNAFRRELAHRSGDGLDVTLLWWPADRHNEESIVVCVSDSRDGAYFEIVAEPHLALEVYYHPFAYRDLSTVDYKDSRLAA